ncbi:unnamed protein product [Brassica napus]|uniref:(rape) hypothetical protein n=1 Tax=Brassica napus TaxID=3708 RepID=A0A816KP01_BRANA|nr:unnamed protein product [Brassica napus]
MLLITTERTKIKRIICFYQSHLEYSLLCLSSQCVVFYQCVIPLFPNL